jgi:hypothetical protein
MILLYLICSVTSHLSYRLTSQLAFKLSNCIIFYVFVAVGIAIVVL